MAGRELIPPSRGENGTVPILPGSVLASHLEASAAGLATGTAARRASACVGTVGELTEVIQALVAGQRYLSDTLAQLATHLDGSPVPAPSPDLDALAEVLRAAAGAAGHTADALAESGPLLDVVRSAAGKDAPF